MVRDNNLGFVRMDSEGFNRCLNAKTERIMSSSLYVVHLFCHRKATPAAAAKHTSIKLLVSGVEA